VVFSSIKNSDVLKLNASEFNNQYLKNTKDTVRNIQNDIVEGKLRAEGILRFAEHRLSGNPADSFLFGVVLTFIY